MDDLDATVPSQDATEATSLASGGEKKASSKRRIKEDPATSEPTKKTGTSKRKGGKPVKLERAPEEEQQQEPDDGAEEDAPAASEKPPKKRAKKEEGRAASTDVKHASKKGGKKGVEARVLEPEEGAEEGGGGGEEEGETVDAEGKKRKRHYRPGTVALKEIRRYQTSYDLLLPRAPFNRIVREITQDMDVAQRLVDGGGLYFTKQAIESLQHASENLLVELFQNTSLVALHARRITIQPKDLHLAYLLGNKK